MVSVTYRSVLVENEERSLARLRRIIGEFPERVEVVGEAMDGPSAVEIIRSQAPDLVFLDIDLPGFDGFQVLERVPCKPAIIFTTAFNQHALQAFQTYAVDYLLKPIDTDAVRRALDKLRALGFNQSQVTRALQELLNASDARYLTRLPCKTGDRTVLVKIGEVLYFQADNKYTAVYTVSNDYLIDTPLVELERRLNPRDFVRIHRGTIVNIPWIAEIRRSYDGKLCVLLKDTKSTQLPASRSFAENLRSL